MNPVLFVFQVIQDWLGTDPEQNETLLGKAMEDYEKSKVAAFFQKMPYLLFLLPLLAPILRAYFNKFMQKVVSDADGDGDQDVYDAALQIVQTLSRKRPASQVAKDFQALQMNLNQ